VLPRLLLERVASIRFFRVLNTDALTMKLFGFASIVAAHGASSLPSIGDRLIASFATPKAMPLERKDAESGGLHQVGVEKDAFGHDKCDSRFGYRYQLDGARIPIVMYNELGHIHGVQIVVNTQEFPLYPGSNLKAHQDVEPTGMSQDEGDWGLTVYFKDPTEICEKAGDIFQRSIGDRLWIADAQEPSGYFQVPIQTSEDELFDGRFKSSACLPAGLGGPGSGGMGLHYWFMNDRHGDTVCKDTLPVFFLYDQGILQGLGIVMIGFNNKMPTVGNARPVGWDDPTSVHLGAPNNEIMEFPRQPLDPYLFAKGDIFKCLENVNMFDNSDFGDVAVATLHLFFQDNTKITCKGNEDRIVKMNHTMGHAAAVV